MESKSNKRERAMAIHAPDMIVDKKDQLEKIEDWCLPDETIRAVFDLKGRGTGFVGITDKRVIFHDKEFLRKQKAMVTIPYSRIYALSSRDDSGFLIKRGFFASGNLTIHVAGEHFGFEFRGEDKAHRAYEIIMRYLLQ